MPNRKAKLRKQKRRKINLELKRTGRTAVQVKKRLLKKKQKEMELPNDNEPQFPKSKYIR